ncbi:MAG: hypothetical protein WAT79_07670 [Saprospiraceae bacterium]
MFTIKNTTKNPKLIDADKIILGIGITALILPLIVYLASFPSQECLRYGMLHSISAYYHTDARDVLVGMICALAFCFLAYNGYSKIDMITSKVAAISALGVALIPTSIFPGEYVCIDSDGTDLREFVHVTCAVILLLTMSIFSIKIFTHRENGETIAPRKLFFYRFWGFSILGSLMLIGLYFLFLKDVIPGISNWYVVFWLEVVCLFAFGCSWLLKSGLFDRKKQEKNIK